MKARLKNCIQHGLGVGLMAALMAGLVACGGGDSSGAGAPDQTTGTATVPVTLAASSTYAQQCDPSNPNAPAASKNGSLSIEKQWIRSYVNEAYLWFDQVPSVDATAAVYSGAMTTLASYNVPAPLSSYFQALKTPQTTTSGAKVDKFSFSYATADWIAFSQAGQSAGYGASVALLSPTVPRKAVITLVDPGTPAAAASLSRGAEILTVDGIDLVNDGTAAGVKTLNAGLFPVTGTTHTFGVRDPGSTAPRTLSLKAQTITGTPVQAVRSIPTATGNVGYMLFTDHTAASEQLLINAINQLKSSNVSDLVLDLRYNGGGYLYVASELAYMIAGPSKTFSNGSSHVFEKLTYNSKRTADTNSSNAATPFYTTSCLLSGNNCTSSQALPTLGLSRVYVLAQSGTCSASEAIVNGLRGVGLDVKLIGGTTCGKPYGFTAKDNCGVSYFPIEFKGVNAAGYGDYSDGFAPTCSVGDDFSKQLGDATEAMLAGALTVRATGLCPGGGALKSLKAAPDAASATGYVLLKSPLRENRWIFPEGRPHGRP